MISVAPPKIVFGWGRRREVGTLGRTLGRRAIVLSGLPPDVAADMLGEIRELLFARHRCHARRDDPARARSAGCRPRRPGTSRQRRQPGLFPARHRRRSGHRFGQGRGRRGHESAKPYRGRLSGKCRSRAEDRRAAAAGTGHAHHGRDRRRSDPQRGHFLVRSAFQEKVFATTASCRGSPWSIRSLRSACRRR